MMAINILLLRQGSSRGVLPLALVLLLSLLDVASAKRLKTLGPLDESDPFVHSYKKKPAAFSESFPDASVINGDDTTFQDYPFYADLSICGSSVFWHDLILTAGHCNPRQYVNAVKVGPNQLEVPIVHGTLHPNYIFRDNPNFFLNNDIMVLKVDRKVTTKAVGATMVNLKTPDDETIADGQSVKLVGLGWTTPSGSPSDILQQLDVNYVNNEQCASMYSDTTITDQMLCAGVLRGGYGSCRGDSGGPLLEEGNTQIGVVSWARVPCGRPRYPDVYARVSENYEWLQQMICCLSEHLPEDGRCDGVEVGPQVCPNHLRPQTTPTPAPTPPPTPEVVCQSGETMFRLELLTDDYAEEIAWELFDTCSGQLIDGNGGFFIYDDNTLYIEQLCLADNSRYTFRILDRFGDGIFDPGYYRIYYGGQLIREGGDYDAEESTSLGASTCPPTPQPTPAPTITCTTGLSIFLLDLLTDRFPDETTWDLVNDCTSEVVARGGGSYLAETRYFEQVCVNAAEKHTFTIYDAAQDGICCGVYGDGEYSLSIDGEVFFTGGEFAAQESTSFGSCGPTISPTPQPTIACSPGSSLFQLNLLTDDYPEDISWLIRNECTGGTVAEGGDYDSDLDNQEINEQRCLEDDNQYTFSIFDEFGDGICCENGFGEYSIEYNGETIRNSDGDYGLGESTTFGICEGPTSPPVPLPTNPPSVRPTPAPTVDCGPGSTLLQLRLLTDNFPLEISWAVTNECNDQVRVVVGGYDLQQTLYEESICLEEAFQWKFTIFDQEGDGICCTYGEGEYSLFYGGVLIRTGGEYEYGESTTFGECRPTPSPTPRPTPLPTTRGPTPLPTPFPTPLPTNPPTKRPTGTPTRQPTPAPTNPPTKRPTGTPTMQPTPAPTRSPTASPTTARPTPTPAPSRLGPTVDYIYLNEAVFGFSMAVSDPTEMEILEVLRLTEIFYRRHISSSFSIPFQDIEVTVFNGVMDELPDGEITQYEANTGNIGAFDFEGKLVDLALSRMDEAMHTGKDKYQTIYRFALRFNTKITLHRGRSELPSKEEVGERLATFDMEVYLERFVNLAGGVFEFANTVIMLVYVLVS